MFSLEYSNLKSPQVVVFPFKILYQPDSFKLSNSPFISEIGANDVTFVGVNEESTTYSSQSSSSSNKLQQQT